MHWELRHYDLEEQKKSTQKLGVVKDATAATRARVTSQNVVPAETWTHHLRNSLLLHKLRNQAAKLWVYLQ